MRGTVRSPRHRDMQPDPLRKIAARIVAIRQVSPSTRSFRLDLGGQDFSFLPGQWVDCYAGADRPEGGVAGYSMTSSPLDTGTIELAVKRVGDNPVTNFLHDRARVGDMVYIEGGQGDFYYLREMGGPLVLIAGGIGITPLMSIARYAHQAAPEVDLTLLYSAGEPSELLFRDELEELEGQDKTTLCVFTITRPSNVTWGGRTGRIDTEMLRQADAHPGALFYVCGPPPMIQGLLALLGEFGADPLRIKYEKWW